MTEFGLKEMTSPVRTFMSYSGQLLPPLRIKRIILWLLTTGSLITLTVLASAELVISAVKKFETIMEIIPILLTFIEMCIRVIYFSKKEKQLMEMVENYNFLPVTCTAFIRSEQKMREVAMQRSRKILFQFSSYVFMMLMVYLSLPFLPKGPDLSDFGFTPNDITQSIVNPLRRRPLYIPMWTPQDVETLDTGEYHVLVIWQGFSFVVLVSVFFASDCLLYTFIIFIVEAMRHLERVEPGNKKIKHIRLRSQNSQHNIHNLAWGLQSENDFRVWVKQHQFLLSLSQEVESLFSPIILITFLVNGSVMCVLAYVLIKLRNVIGIICVLGHFSCIVFKLYIMAKFGQELKDESSQVASNSKMWPRLGTIKQTDARIISLRCNNAITLTGFGYFDLSIELLGKVCSIALSYFVVLLQLH